MRVLSQIGPGKVQPAIVTGTLMETAASVYPYGRLRLRLSAKTCF